MSWSPLGFCNGYLIGLSISSCASLPSLLCNIIFPECKSDHNTLIVSAITGLPWHRNSTFFPACPLTASQSPLPLVLSSRPRGSHLAFFALLRTHQKCSHLKDFTLRIFFPWNAFLRNTYMAAYNFAAFLSCSYANSSEISSLNSISKMHILSLCIPLPFVFFCLTLTAV